MDPPVLPDRPRSGRRRPGPARRFTPEQIADTVLDIGLGDATVGTVAERLGVTRAALYPYVGDRDGMVVAAIDRLCARTAWPELGPDWQAGLEAEAWTWWDLCTAHPGLVEAIAAVQFSVAGVNQRLVHVGGWLLGLGFTPEAAVLAVDLVVDLVFDVATHARSHAPDHPERTAAAAGLHDLAPQLRAVLHDAVTGDPADWLARKLRVVLAGIAAEHAPPPDRRL